MANGSPLSTVPKPVRETVRCTAVLAEAGRAFPSGAGALGQAAPAGHMAPCGNQDLGGGLLSGPTEGGPTIHSGQLMSHVRTPRSDVVRLHPGVRRKQELLERPRRGAQRRQRLTSPRATDTHRPTCQASQPQCLLGSR